MFLFWDHELVDLRRRKLTEKKYANILKMCLNISYTDWVLPRVGIDVMKSSDKFNLKPWNSCLLHQTTEIENILFRKESINYLAWYLWPRDKMNSIDRLRIYDCSYQNSSNTAI